MKQQLSRPTRFAVCTCALAALSPVLPGYGQVDSIPAFNKLRTPVAPAFTILGVEPTSVERPNTPSDIAFAIVNSGESLTEIPENFAMELSPFWLTSHRRLTWEADTIRSIGESALRTLTVSAATGKAGDTASATGFSFGFRTALFSGSVTRRSIAAIRALEHKLALDGSFYNRLLNENLKAANIDERREEELKRAGGDSSKIEEIVARYGEEEEAIKKEVFDDPRYLELSSQIQDFAVEREGFFLEFASAFMWEALESFQFSRLGLWMTPSYQFRDFSLVGVTRYLADQTNSAPKTLDFGGRLVWTHSLFAVSAEYVRRVYVDSAGPPDEYRLMGMFEYMIGRDIWLHGSFGKNFASLSAGNNEAELGVAFNFSSERFEGAGE